MITLRAAAISAVLAVCVLAPAAQAQPERCLLIARGSDGGTVVLMNEKDIGNLLARPPVTALNIPAQYKYPYVECLRNALVPAASDSKLLELGYPVAIKVIGADLRVGLLTTPGGHVQFALLRGPTLTPDEMHDLAPKVDAVQQALEADYAAGTARN